MQSEGEGSYAAALRFVHAGGQLQLQLQSQPQLKNHHTGPAWVKGLLGLCWAFSLPDPQAVCMRVFVPSSGALFRPIVSLYSSGIPAFRPRVLIVP